MLADADAPDHYNEGTCGTLPVGYYEGHGTCPTGTRFVNGCCVPESEWLQIGTKRYAAGQPNYHPVDTSASIPLNMNESSLRSEHHYVPGEQPPSAAAEPTTHEKYLPAQEYRRHNAGSSPSSTNHLLVVLVVLALIALGVGMEYWIQHKGG